MEQRVADLEDELVQIRADLRACRLEVARLRRLVDGGGESAASESGLARSTASDPLASVATFTGVDSYTVVQGPAASSAAPTAVTGQTATGAVPQTWAEREAICVGIGHWVLRCLADRPRGPSGRENLVLSSRVWLVVRNFEGRVLEPARLFHRFSDCRSLVKRGSDLGLSVFVGLPSIREANIVAEVAGTPFEA